jgi:hypothetical protein
MIKLAASEQNDPAIHTLVFLHLADFGSVFGGVRAIRRPLSRPPVAY